MLQHADPALARLIPLLLPGGGHPGCALPARAERRYEDWLAGGNKEGDGDGNAAAQPSALTLLLPCGGCRPAGCWGW
jgi:hypothetical protein